MFLRREEILEELRKGRLKILPFSEELVGPDSVDLRLSNVFLIPERRDLVDLESAKDGFREIVADRILLKPGEFLLASTKERLGLPPDLVGFLHGRSSIGRLGIMVHVTAGIVHAGFGFSSPASLTLEIYSVNPNPVALKQGTPIAQIAFARLSGPTKPYDDLPRSRYKGQTGPKPPLI